ncbi:hypothetical protein OC861_000620 [Tilletia horrida]|nr:hypothetical protein OC845_000771 [Tilletia horrida]KAK0569783.1 hypothetical protein OC861_000620 [Tilletia horrida]
MQSHTPLSEHFSAVSVRKAREAGGYAHTIESPTRFESDDYEAEVLLDAGDSPATAQPYLSFSGRGRPSMDRRSQLDPEDDYGFDDDGHDLDDYGVYGAEDHGIMRSPTPAMGAGGPARRRSFVPTNPTAATVLAMPGLAADDLPGAKARKVLGLDQEGWEIGPGSEAEGSSSLTSKSSLHSRPSTSKRATARVTALLGGGSNSSHSNNSSSAALSSAVTDGLPGIQGSSTSGAGAGSSSSSSRRHSLLPAMLGLAGRRPSSQQTHQHPIAERPHLQQTSSHTVDSHFSGGNAPFPAIAASATSFASAGSAGSSYFTAPGAGTVGPGTPGIPSSSSLPIGLSASMSGTSPRGSGDAISGGPSNGLVPMTSPAPGSGSTASGAAKSLRNKVRGRKHNAPGSGAGSEDLAGVTATKGVAAVSLEDAQDWERALETAERNASWYSSIAHRPRPRPAPSGQPSKGTGTPVPRAGSTSSASSTPTTDQSHHSLFYAGPGASALGPSSLRTATLHSHGAITVGGAAGQDYMLGGAYGLGIGNGSVRRSASTSNLLSPTLGYATIPYAATAAAAQGIVPAGEQQEELLDDAASTGMESGSSGHPSSAYPPLLGAHPALGSPIRSQSVSGVASSSKMSDHVGTRSPSLVPTTSDLAGNRYSTVSTTMGSPDRFGLQSYSSGSRLSRYSVMSNSSTASGMSNNRPRRPSNDPHPLPPSMISGAPLDSADQSQRGRRPSLGNEQMVATASVPGWQRGQPIRGTGAERTRSGSFGAITKSAATPGSVFGSTTTLTRTPSTILGHRRGGMNSSSDTSSVDSGRDSALVGDEEMDGALGHAFRTYRAQLNGEGASDSTQTSALELEAAPKVDEGGAEAGKKNHIRSTTASTEATATGSPRTPVAPDRKAETNRTGDVSVSTPKGHPNGNRNAESRDGVPPLLAALSQDVNLVVSGDHSDTTNEECDYYRRDLPEDIPRPVSVYSDSLEEDEEDGGEGEGVRGEEGEEGRWEEQ